MKIAIKDKEEKSIDLKLDVASYKEYLTICDMCKANNLILIIYEFGFDEE